MAMLQLNATRSRELKRRVGEGEEERKKEFYSWGECVSLGAAVFWLSMCVSCLCDAVVVVWRRRVWMLVVLILAAKEKK